MPRSPKQSQPKPEGSTPKRRTSIPDKCRKCAMLSAAQAQNLHGAEGDGCWNPAVCYSRRSYARHRDRINQTRKQKRRDQLPQALTVDLESFADLRFAVLLVYRPPGVDTPIHAIGAEVWQGQEKCAVIPPIHCAGMVSSQVHTYVSKMLGVLETHYSIRKFASQERLDVSMCPLRPCPHHPEGVR